MQSLIFILALTLLGCPASSSNSPAERKEQRRSEVDPSPPGDQTAPTIRDDSEVASSTASGTNTGSCESLLELAARRWDSEMQSWGELDTPEKLEVVELPDVNADGRKELAVVHPYRSCGTTGNCVGFLYLSRDPCPQAAGTIAFRETYEVLETKHAGVNDIRYFLVDGCAGLAGSWRYNSWNGTRFEHRKSVSCACPDELPEGAERDPECPR